MTEIRTKEEAYREIRRLGFDQAIAEFSGGNDEGGVDAICLIRDGERQDVNDDWYEQEGSLGFFLEDIVLQQYDFNGEGYVYGRVVVDAVARTVRIDSTVDEPVSRSYEL